MRQVVGGALRWIVREERVANAERGHPLEKGQGAREQRAAFVDRAIHVESDVRDVAQVFAEGGRGGGSVVGRDHYEETAWARGRGVSHFAPGPNSASSVE